MRIGWGFDAHRFGGSGPLKLGGIVVSEQGLAGTSDADVLAHAVADGLLGAAALGDLGTYFPSDDPQWEDADSMNLLTQVVVELGRRGLSPAQVDATVISQTVPIAPHRERIRDNLARVLGLDRDRVSVKATTTDHMGFIGRDEGMAAVAAVVLGEIAEAEILPAD